MFVRQPPLCSVRCCRILLALPVSQNYGSDATLELTVYSTTVKGLKTARYQVGHQKVEHRSYNGSQRHAYKHCHPTQLIDDQSMRTISTFLSVCKVPVYACAICMYLRR